MRQSFYTGRATFFEEINVKTFGKIRIAVISFVALFGALLLLTSAIVVGMPKARVSEIIYIRPDGSVDPPTAPIQRIGDLYILTSNISNSIVLQIENVVIDGNGFTLNGGGRFGTGLSSDTTGPSIKGSHNITVRNTEIVEYSIGIFLAGAFRCSIVNNSVMNNQCGVLVSDDPSLVPAAPADGDIIIGNNVVGNEVGIYFWNSFNCSAVGNNVVNNSIGIRVLQSSITIYHNNFIDNTNQTDVFGDFYGSRNTWSIGYPLGGNYWSNYIGSDLKSGPGQDRSGPDGIGDAPYYVDDLNIDHYPLMGSWGKWVSPPPLLGDVNGDGKINILDIWLIAKAYNSTVGNLRYNPGCDLNNDGFINMTDLLLVAENFRKTHWQT
jgi:parallel beta-helix repeat protein